LVLLSVPTTSVGSGVAVGGISVAIAVGMTVGVAVGGTDVAVGVTVGGTDVVVDVAVDGTDVAVGVTVGVLVGGTGVGCWHVLKVDSVVEGAGAVYDPLFAQIDDYAIIISKQSFYPWLYCQCHILQNCYRVSYTIRTPRRRPSRIHINGPAHINFFLV